MTLIDKEALLEKLSTFHPDYTFNITSFRNFIKAQPEVEKKGKWILKPNIYGVAYCSECDYELHTDNTNYCPHCGARMEESDG